MRKTKRKTRETYSHRGDRIRRNDRIRKGLLVLALIGAVTLIPQERPRDAQASTGGFTFGLTADARQLRVAFGAPADARVQVVAVQTALRSA